MNWLELTLVWTYSVSMVIAFFGLVSEIVSKYNRGITTNYEDLFLCFTSFIPIFNTVLCCMVISTAWDKVKYKTAFNGKKR